jgi:hypothetical protein
MGVIKLMLAVVFFDRKMDKKEAVFFHLSFAHPILILYSRFAVHSLKILRWFIGGFGEKLALFFDGNCAILGRKGRREKWCLLIFDLLSFVLTQKKVTKKKSRLHKNFLFSTGRHSHAIQAAPPHWPTLASVSL